MSVILVRHDGQVAAFVSPNKANLTDYYDRLPNDDPVKRAVLVKCAYAMQVARGDLDGPYSDAEADEIARVAAEADAAS